MYFFCENCGNKLESDARFCENCGSAVSYNICNAGTKKNKSFDLTLFDTKNWEDEWIECVSNYDDFNTGIILMNTAGCPDEDLDYFMSRLEDYIDFSKSSGTIYIPVDLATQKVIPGINTHDINSVLSVLKNIYDCAVPDYLMIIGDRNSVPSAKWENRQGDEDEFIDSDLCYFTLDMKSPFEKLPSNFYACPARIPASAQMGFSQACDYFDNVIDFDDSSDNIKAIALSAEEWLNVSELNFKGACAEVYSCPPNSFLPDASKNTLYVGEEYNLFCFNLHGGSRMDYWLSGDETLAYSPECLPRGYNKYVLCTEACYGAKPIIRNNGRQSILVTALQNGCIAFCGSSQIAYGTVDKGLCNGKKPYAADVVIGSFAGSVYDGDTTGNAYFNAISAILNSDDFLTDEDVKTLASFALYGDPSLCLASNNGNKFSVKNAKSTGFSVSPAKKKGSGFITFPDVRLAVSRRIPDVSAKIKDAISMCVAKVNSDFSDIEPEYYEVGGVHKYKAAFKKKNKDRNDYMSIYVDKNGSVSKVYVSK